METEAHRIFKAKLRADFNRAAETYDSVANIQKIIAEETILRARKTITSQAPIILDAGCGTGFASTALQRNTPQARILACDIAEKMVKKTRAKHTQLSGVVCDMEQLPFADHSINYLVSSVALQWSKNLERVWTEWNRVLAPNGVMTVSLFTQESLKELKALNTQFGSPLALEILPSIKEIKQSLAHAHIEATLEMQYYNETYPDLWTLLRTLKTVGARAKTVSMPYSAPLSKTRIAQVKEHAGEMRVTWEVAFMRIEKRSHSSSCLETR